MIYHVIAASSYQKYTNTNCVNFYLFLVQIRRQQQQQQTNSKRKNYVDDNRPT